MATITQGIKLDEETRARLKALGKQRDRSPHWLMKRAIHNYLDKEEAYEREKREDEERWQNYKKYGGIDHSEVEPWLKHIASGGRKSWQEFNEG